MAVWRPSCGGSGLGGVIAAALLLPLGGLLATLPVARGRARLGMVEAFAVARAARFGRLGRVGGRAFAGWRRAGAGERLSLLGRRPQGVIVPVVATGAGAALWALWPAAGAADPVGVLLGGVAIVATFPLLVAERMVAGMPRSTLPEAPGMQALLFVPVLVIPVAGVIEILAGLGVGQGLGLAQVGFGCLAAYLGVVAVELGARALANWFLPPGAPGEARAAVTSLAALALQPRRMAPDGLAAPIRDHLGIDFSRSWALRYVRSAAVPVFGVLALVAWGLTGVSLIDLDRRGVYERMGAPVAVWAPGAHLGLPWPLGQVRRVELGTVHAVLLGGSPAVPEPSGAEDPAPASADRLWETEHPSEVSYLLASRDTAGGQSFQSVSVDARVLYRTGLDDGAAMRAAYAVAVPEQLVRAEAGRLLAGVFAGQVLTRVLGEDREQMAEGLRARLQGELDRLGSGVEVVAVVIEAIHPPAGAAQAYHAVQAAEIIANTTVAVERGKAVTAATFSRQRRTDMVDGAAGGAAEVTADARVLARGFAADREAAQVGGAAFLLERYLANVSTALAKSPLVIVDHRLGGADGPVIDLRAFGAPPARTGDED